ncbi:hypothetical protein ABT061_17160 [Streptosporangium sp. NPDC002544]|uniref:hypothetical protein n=1 Tax=Streptosporangium sp. NPDC002544 TaxID=3154538 RepID=UPI00331D3B5B
MRSGHSTALAMLGYVLGALAATVLGQWAYQNHQELLGETMIMSALLCRLAFLFGLVRLAFRGVRRLTRTSARAHASARLSPTPKS